MALRRNATSRWHREVPGARWFKADLHIHTIDVTSSGALLNHMTIAQVRPGANPRARNWRGHLTVRL